MDPKWSRPTAAHIMVSCFKATSKLTFIHPSKREFQSKMGCSVGGVTRVEEYSKNNFWMDVILATASGLLCSWTRALRILHI
ncbi:hypothetical protein TorRG33x02_338620 [Trema orientale]|uniref:Uncharacterized protein n=1 Tax=Trema orientale TaxID=63057 RepID=A0A2P5AXF7_TREOI|nr:hypothetical protein TorRG33x02_338620 [Trema orientale]